MITTSKWVLIILSSILIQSPVLGGGAEGHGGGEFNSNIWRNKIRQARFSLESLISFPTEFSWTQVSVENQDLFALYQPELKIAVTESRVVILTRAEEFFNAEECLILSDSLQFTVAPSLCADQKVSTQDLILKMSELFLRKLGASKTQIRELARDLEILTRQKFIDFPALT